MALLAAMQAAAEISSFDYSRLAAGARGESCVSQSSWDTLDFVRSVEESSACERGSSCTCCELFHDCQLTSSSDSRRTSSPSLLATSCGSCLTSLDGVDTRQSWGGYTEVDSKVDFTANTSTFGVSADKRHSVDTRHSWPTFTDLDSKDFTASTSYGVSSADKRHSWTSPSEARPQSTAGDSWTSAGTDVTTDAGRRWTSETSRAAWNSTYSGYQSASSCVSTPMAEFRTMAADSCTAAYRPPSPKTYPSTATTLSETNRSDFHGTTYNVIDSQSTEFTESRELSHNFASACADVTVNSRDYRDSIESTEQARLDSSENPSRLETTLVADSCSRLESEKTLLDDSALPSEPSYEAGSCMNDLLSQLKSEVCDLRHQGTDISRQMWLLYVTFEDFLHIKHPDTAARMKRYRQPSRDERPNGTSTSTPTNKSGSKRKHDVSAGAVTHWLDNACHLHTSVAETTDWLRPEEEFEDWSDDTDRVRKLREAEVANAEAAAAAASQADESSLIDLEPFMCMNNSLHTRVKKIDKSTVRRMRSRSRTPERRNRNFNLATLPDNGRLLIEAPVIDCDLATSSQGLISPKQCSPVTTSSGYGSDHDCLRERDIDTILYGTLPPFPTHPMAGEGREAPGYVVMSGGKDSEAEAELSGNQSDMLRHNGVLADKALDAIMARMKVSAEGQGHKRVFFKDDLGVKDVSRNENEDGEDSEEDQSGSVYQNLPAALYAQVSPPRPQAVYKSQGKLQSQPIWESTPLDEGHRPRIMQQSGGRDSSISNSAKDIRSLIRKRMGLLADDKTPVNSPLAYQSAFRPYTSSQGTPCLKPAGREHSIAEYRRSQDSQYLCMTTARKQTPSLLGSVLVDDVILQSAAAATAARGDDSQDDDSQLQDDTLCAESHNSSGSSDSGRGTCSVDGEHHKMEDLVHETDPIYETIPDTTGASLATTKSEHDYCRIGDVASMLELSSDAAVPSPPPQRYPPQHLVRNAGQGPDVTSADGPRNSKLRILRPNERVQQSDIVDMDGFHTYTVGDVLESFGRFAGHLPPPKARGNLYSMFPEHRERRRVSRSLKVETSGDVDDKAAVVGRTGSGKRTALGQKKLQQKVHRGAANSSLGGTLPTKLYPGEAKPVRPQPRKLNPQGELPRPDVQPVSAAIEPILYENLPAHQLPKPRAPGADFEFSTMVKETRPTRRPGAHYYGADTAGSIKKTLSFGDLSPGSTGSQESIEIFIDGTPSESGSPVSQPRAQHFQRACHQRHPAAVARHSTMAPTQQQPQQRHQRFRSDDLTDMTSHTGTSGTADNSACDPVYQNVRELQLIREQKIKMAALARSSINRLPTPLRRTQSALHLQWNRNTVETQEIFC